LKKTVAGVGKDGDGVGRDLFFAFHFIVQTLPVS
jgi:hypothetical protein